jgi:hypothetical protein
MDALVPDRPVAIWGRLLTFIKFLDANTPESVCIGVPKQQTSNHAAGVGSARPTDWEAVEHVSRRKACNYGDSRRRDTLTDTQGRHDMSESCLTPDDGDTVRQ